MRYSAIRYFFVFLFFVVYSFGAVNTVSILDATDDASLLEHSQIYIQQNAKLEYPKEPIKGGAYKPSNTDFISRGYTTGEAVWVRFSLRNDSNTSIQRNIHIDNSMLDSVTIYEDGTEPKNTGALNRMHFDGIVDFYFPITLKAGETKGYYLRILSNSCATYFHLNAETRDTLWLKTSKRELTLMFFGSIMFAMLVYNAFIYAFTREKQYLYYALFLIFVSYNHFFSYCGMLLPIAIYLGISDEFIRWWTSVDAYIGAYYMAGIAISFILFFAEVINLCRFRRIYRPYMSIIGLLVLLCIVTLLGIDYALDLIVYVCTLAMIFSFFIITYLLYKREENSIYLFFGLGSNIGGHMLFLLYNFGTYIPKGGYWYFYEMSIAIEAFLFSIVLSRKLNHTKALETALATQKILIRELHHRVKNNLQFIVSLYRLKLKKHLDEGGKTMLTEAEQNIRSIGKIHEILYNQQNISELNAREYFEDLAGEIKRGYPSEDINISIDGSMQLSIDHAIYCGLIVNELVTNAIKHAFSGKSGQVNIKLGDKNGLKTLIVSDNGVGFDTQNTKHSFGLTLVEKLAKDELKGSVNTEAKDGVTHTLEWY